jgi:hypothetical protein
MRRVKGASFLWIAKAPHKIHPQTPQGVEGVSRLAPRCHPSRLGATILLVVIACEEPQRAAQGELVWDFDC